MTIMLQWLDYKNYQKKIWTNFWSGASWGQFHKLIYTLPQSICALHPTFYCDKKCVDDKHPLAGRDIQYWAPDSQSRYTTPFNVLLSNRHQLANLWCVENEGK